MAEYTPESATTVGLKDAVSDVTISPQTPDSPNLYGKTWWDFPDTSKYLGYYKEIPQLKSALKIFTMRIVGLGYEVESSKNKAVLENLGGNGKETFIQIMSNFLVQKKVFGDAFLQIIRNDNGTLINLKPMYPGDTKIFYDDNGLVDKYQVRDGKEWKDLKTEEVFHMMNDRLGNEIHGISIIESLKMVIDAKNEAFTDEKAIRHRDRALGIVEYDTDDTGKITNVNTQIQTAVKNGDMLGIPKDTVEIKEFPNKSPADRIQWLQYLDNLFYQIVGVPKVLVTSEGFTEAGGKAGLLAFEPNEIAEKKEVEEAFWNQIAIRLELSRAPSIVNNVQSDEAKNTGQTGIQPNETEVRPTRTE